MKLGQIAKKLNCVLQGDPEIEIRGIAGINDAKPGELTFLANRKYAGSLATTRASAILLSAKDGPVSIATLRSENPYLDFARAIELFHEPLRYAPGTHSTAVISTSARIGDGAHIGPYCFVGEDVELGRNAVLHSFVTVYRGAKIGDDFFAHSHACVREGCRVGNRVILQNGVVIGGDGFGFAKDGEGHWHKMRQAGIAVIGDDVEIQANSTVDRATVGETRIGRGTKLDDLVLIGHSATIGEDTLLCGQVALAGSTHIGNRCILAGQAGCAGHLTVGDGAILTAQAGLGKDVPRGAIFSGSPAFPNDQWRKCVAVFNRLPDMQKALREVRNEIERIRVP